MLSFPLLIFPYLSQPAIKVHCRTVGYEHDCVFLLITLIVDGTQLNGSHNESDSHQASYLP